MKIRRNLLVILVAFILIAALSTVYLSFEVLKLPLQKDEFLDKEKISVLEGRLQKLEEELRKNKQFLNQLTNEDKQLPIKFETEGATYSQHRNIIISRGNSSFANVPILMCSKDAIPLVAKSDIQFPDAYSEIDFENTDGGVWKQGWPLAYDESQWNQNNQLKVIVVPHSHNDPGWIKTFENYYLDQTRYILNNMVKKLKEHSKMKIIWAEVSFLALWWERASLDERREMTRLVRNGQLEIVTGGWVMNDEAVAHYFAIIEQLVEGHEWLENHLNYHPENGWGIDPFGLSPTQAYLLKRMGLNHMIIQRVHYSVKKYLAKLKSLEFQWRQAWDQANVTDIFCHVMPFYSYDVPHTCGPDPKICCQFDFKRLPGGKIGCPWKVAPVPINSANVADRAALLLDQYRKKSQLYRTNVVFIPLGDDFRFDKAVEWDQQYQNYQALFDFMNSKTEWNVNAQFGTLRDYFGAVNDEINRDISHQNRIEIPSLSGDFFTYADRDDHYWSGYFSSRPLYKNMDRILESYLRAGEIIFTSTLSRLSKLKLAGKFPTDELLQHLVVARRNLGLFQHHDAVAGTAKDPVVIDYGKRLLLSVNGLQTLIGKTAAFLLSPPGEELKSSITFDLDENWASHSSMAKKTLIDVGPEGRTVAFYNSLGHRRQQIVHLLVSVPKICVFNLDETVVLAQLAPLWHGTDLIDDKFELSFLVDVPALGLSTYVLRPTTADNQTCLRKSPVTIYNAPSLPTTTQAWDIQIGESSEVTVENFQLRLSFSSDGLLTTITSLYDNLTDAVSVSFLIYGTTHKKDKSGAYLFLPNGEATPLEYDQPYFRVTKGILVSEVRTFLPFVEHSVQIRSVRGLEGGAVHVSNIVDITSEVNKELVMRVKSSISNSKQFFTDLNGFQMMKRETTEKIPIQGNFYPISAAAFIEDRHSRLTVLTGQSLGGASLESGWLEIILDRRLNQDDNRGLQQGVLDNKITPSSFTFLIERRTSASSETNSTSSGLLSLTAHHLSHSLLYPILRLIDVTDGESHARKLLPNYSLLENDFPCDMHVLNLRTATSEILQQSIPVLTPKNYSLLLIHHLGCDCNIYTPLVGCTMSNDKINMKKLFGNNNFENEITEVTLSGLYDFEKFPQYKEVYISPMEINAYKLRM